VNAEKAQRRQLKRFVSFDTKGYIECVCSEEWVKQEKEEKENAMMMDALFDREFKVNAYFTALYCTG